MSLAIDIDKVTGVMVAGKWFTVWNKSFDIDAYEFLQGDRLILGGGDVRGVVTTGATWKDKDGVRYNCPLTAIQVIEEG